MVLSFESRDTRFGPEMYLAHRMSAFEIWQFGSIFVVSITRTSNGILEKPGFSLMSEKNCHS